MILVEESSTLRGNIVFNLLVTLYRNIAAVMGPILSGLFCFCGEISLEAGPSPGSTLGSLAVEVMLYAISVRS